MGYIVSLKTRLILNFSVVILVSTLFSVYFGVRSVGNTIVAQAQEKVRLDLNSAREIYQNELNQIRQAIRLTALRFFLKDKSALAHRSELIAELQQIREREGLDVLNLTDPAGRVVIRSLNPDLAGDPLDRQAVRQVLADWQTNAAVSATQVASGPELAREHPDLAHRAEIPLLAADEADPISMPTADPAAGMVLGAAAPVLDYQGRLIGVLYGEKLLNRDNAIVDRIRDILFQDQRFEGKELGTATIFLDDRRIATNVRDADGRRAIGTQVSREVYDQVIGRGIPWIHRALVVQDWYITAYEPLCDLDDRIIGMLYVGILEAPYVQLRNRVILQFLVVALLSVTLLIIVGYRTAIGAIKPINTLMEATRKVARGDLSHRVTISSPQEIAKLAESFNRMTADLEKVTIRYQELTLRLEQRVEERTQQLSETQEQLHQAAKLSSLGKMAAGVAHEINNPLTSIMINAGLAAEETLDDPALQEKLKIINEEAARCRDIVRDLLQFARESRALPRPGDINRVLERMVGVLRNQISLHNVDLHLDLAPALPRLFMDETKIGQVVTNLILNALDAMPSGGELWVTSEPAEGNNEVKVVVRDTGTGISPEHLHRVFDPFFTTKGTRGTGLGLSVSYGIVEQHGGRIDMESRQNHGTTVAVILPTESTGHHMNGTARPDASASDSGAGG
ncbi:MAG: cache domain-containing protein [Acidobacteria bacterium]|nr:cache domain-containing protein [Acidobacteriota bacterium]